MLEIRPLPQAVLTSLSIATWYKNLALIGRAEQIDVVHGLSSSYACASCCPYYFSDAWCDPGNVTGLPGDTTQFRAWEKKRLGST
jgi:hypothetical protein